MIEIAFNNKENFGEYGIHNGFFNFIAILDNVEYYVQCCADDDSIDEKDCGYDWGICEEVNEKLANKIGWEAVYELIEKAYIEFKNA